MERQSTARESSNSWRLWTRIGPGKRLVCKSTSIATMTTPSSV
uniref:Uncharacterized protein n=1 Tax=Pristionchus pacificus TaxID=54126 RepID=A0A2A6C7J8_PRIPA|eukprot:PDM74175.1 hypothetical protein PRIPAC_41531 [Pristionchus pacificus]